MTAPLFWTPSNKASAECIRHFVREATKQKQWAEGVDADWTARASDMSHKWVQDLRRSSVHAIARQSLDYCRMRARLGIDAQGKGWPHDRPAHLLWVGLNAPKSTDS